MAFPEERYVKLRTMRRADGKLVYRSCRPATVVSDLANDTTIYASEMDRLDVIANNVYGSSESWWKIAAANHQVNGSISVSAGSKLLIPKVF
jgi:hypothetical protein